MSGRAALSLTLAAVSMALSGCASYYDGPVSDHFDGERFYNPPVPKERSFLDFWRWRLGGERGWWPEHVTNRASDRPPARVPGDRLRVSFVNHATVLIQTAAVNVLTDPHWSDRASPFSWIGPRRVCAPGVDFADLPAIDVVVVSHNHYDHMDLPTLKRLCARDAPLLLVPLGNDAIVGERCGAQTVRTLDWGEGVSVGNVTLTLEPAQHWSKRWLFDRNEALWGAFVIEAPGGAVYFAGDTGYGGGEHFRAAAEKYGGFRLALLPIGAYEPRWFMARHHVNPEEAVRAHRDLRASRSLGIHYATFQLTDEAYGEPLRDLAAARRRLGVSEKRFRALTPGEHWWVPLATPAVGAPL